MVYSPLWGLAPRPHCRFPVLDLERVPRRSQQTLDKNRFLFACTFQQKLNYRKQIARKLRTQYVEGIYRSNYP